MIIIQARMSSKRLPGKAMSTVGNALLVDHVIKRALPALPKSRIFLATSDQKDDDVLANYVENKYGINIFRGNLQDVRSRFIGIGNETSAKYGVRITADDPFKDPGQISIALQELIQQDLDYFCNFNPRVFPIGLDVEAFKFEALYESATIYNSNSDFEHVTIALRESGKFKENSLKKSAEFPSIRLTIDTPEDLIYCDSIARLIEKESEDNYSWGLTKKFIG